NTDLNVTIQRLYTTQSVTFNSANVVISEMANVGSMTIGYRTYANGVVIPNNITFIMLGREKIDKITIIINWIKNIKINRLWTVKNP
ncbi:MAG TPA: hypothetical protein PLI52_03950, partial [Prochlorococcaceae cyanobacterium AMR_MDS_5431]|nr:hypothetical protein [Prochlorococcaceae cyanobacterium AMR_MDS_5431]